MKLAFFSTRFLARLRDAADTNAANYSSNASWIETFAAGQLYVRESKQVVDPRPTLIFTGDSIAQHDAENAKRVYTWLAALSPAMAMEERLWAYLTHCGFPEYMNARWPVNGASAVHRRYLFEGKSFAALSRNGIARLWWAGYLTRDVMRANPFELTETLFMRQDIQVSLLERSLGKCGVVRTAVLEYLHANRDQLGAEAFGKRIQVLIRELNLLGGVAILDSLPPAAIQAYLKQVGAQFTADAKA